jgi:hypothetical protein
MNRTLLSAALGLIVVGTVPPAWSGCIIRQPWTYNRPPYQSRVVSCDNPMPEPKIALDDFVCEEGATLVRLRWWGWLSNVAQGQRDFYIAIYLDNGNCQPQFPAIAEWCIAPENPPVFVGNDCQAVPRPVYRMTVGLPGGFVANAGQRYWLQISEDDSTSLTPNQDDFRWSAHRPENVPTCWALEYPPLALLPLDVCDNQRNELAFGLRSQVLHIVVPDLPIHRVFGATWAIARLNPALVLQTGIVEFDSSGHAFIETDVPEGSYALRLYITGSEPVEVPVAIMDGTESMLSILGTCLGDADGNGVVDFEDINKFVECLSAF